MKHKVVFLLMALIVAASILSAVLLGARASTTQGSQDTHVTQLVAHSSSTSFPRVQGSQIIDGSGHPLILRGAEIESAFDTMGRWQSGTRLTNVLNSTIFTVMVRDWKMNALRLCLSNWIYAKYSTSYLKALDQAVQEANAAGLYVILNLHDDGNAGSPYGDNADLPKTQDNAFWQVIAGHYKSNPMVLFDLYNEPKDTSWSQWLNGGGKVAGATVVGHQTMVNTIRAAGAKQVIIAEPGTSGGRGKGWSTVSTSSLIKDANIMYSLHLYSHIADTAQQLDVFWGPILNHYPIYYGEWALLVNGNGAHGVGFCQNIVHSQADQDVTNFLKYMASRGASWTAWEFGTYHLIQNYTNFTPTTLDIPWKCGDSTSHAGMGAMVKLYMTTGK
ncbi:MAG: hypothetical protein NVSMB33_03610 [Ktedonobacteraceae bacterium]